MSVLSKSCATFAVLFMAALFGLSGWNAYTEGGDLYRAATRRLPKSVQDIRDVSDQLRATAESNLAGKYAAWEAYALIQVGLGKSEMNNFSVLKGSNGRLYRGSLYPLDLENARKLAEEVAAFAEIAAEKNTKVLYINTPDTMFKGEVRLAANMPYRNFNAAQDAFLYMLREKGVSSLDARYALGESNLAPEDFTIKTGFLLTGKGAFSVFADTLSILEREFSRPLDPDGFYRNLENYTVTERPGFFMGEMGKETGPAFSGLDTFTSIAPAFETSLQYEAMDMFGNFVKTEGRLEETILNPDALRYYTNVYTLYPQSYYRHTNTAWSSIKNLLNPGGPKVLVIHDFYTAQIISHFAPLCGEVHTLAYQEGFPLNASQYIQNNDFDYVIITFFSQNLIRPEMQSLMTGNE